MSIPSNGLLVAAHGRGPAARMAQAWAARGRSVVLLGDAAVEATPGLTSIPCRFDTAAAVRQAFGLAVERLGGLTEAVFGLLPDTALAHGEMASLPLAAWQGGTHATVKPALYALQAVSALATGPCAVTLLGPNVSLVGAAGLVPLCTAIEAQRSLAKSAARQLGARGIRINWVAIGSTEFDAAFGGLTLPAVPELGPPPPALNRRIDLEADVMPAVEFLGSAAARGVTGLTMNLDGGDWMLP